MQRNHRHYGKWSGSLAKDAVGNTNSFRIQSPSFSSSLVVTGSVNDDLMNILSEAGLLRSQMPSQDTPAPEKIRLSVELSHERVASLMDQVSSTHMLLIYRRPESLLVDALNRGDNLKSVAEDWQQHALGVLGLFRRYRCRTTLIDQESVCLQPNQMLAILEGRLSVSLNLPKIKLSNTKKQDNHLETLIARCFVREAVDMRFLLAEIEAGSSTQVIEDPANLANELVKLRNQLRNERAETEKVKDEHEFLLLRLHQAEEELELYFQQNQQLKSSLDSVTCQLKESEKGIKSVNITLSDIRAISTQRQKEIGAMTQDLQETKITLKRAIDKLNSREKALEQIRQSGSWKITAPFRKLLGLFLTSKA